MRQNEKTDHKSRDAGSHGVRIRRIERLGEASGKGRILQRPDKEPDRTRTEREEKEMMIAVFFGGMIFGAFLGIVCAGLMAAAGREDRQREENENR